MTIKPAVRGDVGDYRIVKLGGIADLSAATAVAAHVRYRDVRATLDASVEDAEACTVRVELGDADGWLATTASAGAWMFEVKVTFADGSTRRWPAGKPDSMPVRDGLDAP